LRFEPRELADRGVRFIKVPAALLLDPKQTSSSDIHPSDLSDLLGRFGIDLIAEKIEGERAVVDLLDYDVRFGQGFLFAPPRPLRPEGANGGASINGSESGAPRRRPRLGVIGIMTSAADLEFLTHARQNHVQELQIESGTRIISLIVPMTFRSS
jgi:hypothetical protein